MSIIRLQPDGPISASALAYKNRCVPEKKDVSVMEIAAQLAAELPGVTEQMAKDVMRFMFEEIVQGLLRSGEMLVENTLYRLVSIDGRPVELPELGPEDEGLFVIKVALSTQPPGLKMSL